MENGLEQQVLAKAQKWLDGNYDAETKKQVKYLMDNDMKELVESFYKDLEFGTGGLRGVMGVGTNRMNIYTVGAATQGLSNYLKRNFAGEEIRVVVGHDSRNNSRMFAERVADIFASNGFTVFLFDALRPTPELSFAIRELKCQSGVVVTASHNPKEYNGYKAYWSDGSQVTAPHDKNIIDEVEKITEVDQVLTGRNPQNIHALGKDFDELYLNKIYELSLSSESVKRFHDMKIVYSPMHGAGVRLVPESLKRFGFTNVQMVPEQAVIDAIDPKKDVDAFHPVNVGKIMVGNFDFVPCTPAGVMELLDEYGIDPKGKECVVVGRSNIVGKPMSMLLLHRHGTVTICHSRTSGLAAVCRRADILVAAVGKAGFITPDMVKDGAVVIDVGINRNAEGKVCGDVAPEVMDKASYMTPVPGGAGPMTITMLMKNTLKAAKLQHNL